jgi:hypothetical protein
MPKSAPFGLEASRLEAAIQATDEFLSSVQMSANKSSNLPPGAATPEHRAKIISVISNALSKISTSSLMCLVCCLPDACLNDISKFSELSQKEIQVEAGIERVERNLADASLSVAPLPKSPVIPNDSDDIRVISGSKIQGITTGISDCLMHLLLFQKHHHAGVFLQHIQEVLGVVVGIESCLLLLSSVQDTWIRSRAFISAFGNQFTQMLQPGDMRTLAENQKLISRVIAQIQATPNVLEICSSTSAIPRILPIIWQNLEAFAVSLSHVLLENRLKLPESFALNDNEAAEILSMGCNNFSSGSSQALKFFRTFNMFPSIQGIFVQFAVQTSLDEGSTGFIMHAEQLVSESGEKI